MLAITTRRKLTQEQFLAIGDQVKAEIGERPAMPSTGPLTFGAYRTVSDRKFQNLMARYDAQYAACRAWDRAFKARFNEIADEHRSQVSDALSMDVAA